MIKTYETHISTLRVMPVAAFREKFNIPANLKGHFYFAWNSFFDKEMSTAEESSAKVIDLIQNYDGFVETLMGFKKKKSEDEDKVLKLKIFMREYQIPPTFPNKKKYADCLG